MTLKPHARMYEELKELSPWEVRLDDMAVKQVEQCVARRPDLANWLLDRLLPCLATFPPNPDIFTDPLMSWGVPDIWITVSEHHLRIRIKAEYRRPLHQCWVIQVQEV